jgi:hypothetical protein
MIHGITNIKKSTSKKLSVQLGSLNLDKQVKTILLVSQSLDSYNSFIQY